MPINLSLSEKALQFRLPRWLKRTLWACVGLYALLGTSVWNWFYGFALGITYPAMSIQEIAAHPACVPGDWVLQTFQPMVSDARMIEHWEKNKADMTLAAEMASNAKHLDESGLTREARALHKKISVEAVGAGLSWSVEPYSIEHAKAIEACFDNAVLSDKTRTVDAQKFMFCKKQRRSSILIRPTFGKTHEQYFCTTQRNTFKQYVYFPDAVPRIVGGHLQGPVLIDGQFGWKQKVVPSTDLFDGKECTMRQLDERWFISLCG